MGDTITVASYPNGRRYLVHYTDQLAMQTTQTSSSSSSVLSKATATRSITTAPIIRRLTIEHFRGIERLEWYPTPGVNVILGGGDVGKTTVLDAIALLLHPTYTMVLSDADYWRREVEKSFCIEAVMSLPDTCEISQQTKHAWPWEWDGKEPTLPRIDEDPEAGRAIEPVYWLRVRGTPEFDVCFEVLQPDGTADHLAVAVRRNIGLVRLGGDDRNDRDLRLVQGSALYRLLSDKALRARLGRKLADSDVEAELTEEAKENLEALEKAFRGQALPTGLGLGLTGDQRLSVNALLGLTTNENGVKLPLASWGAGTRRLAALEIAAVHQGEYPITVVDEIERGLEPYRQRILMAALHERGSQVFLTTHSAAALSAASDAALWYMDCNGAIGQLPETLAPHRKRDPEAFLSRITVVAEGATEVGFVGALLEKAIASDLLDYGLWITDGCGNDSTLKMLEALANSRLAFAGFADDEELAPTRWEAVKRRLGNLLFRWSAGCLEENVVKLVPDDRLEEFIKDPDGDSGVRLRTLAQRLEITEKDFSIIKAKATDLRQLIIDAATGTVPDNKKDADKVDKKAMRSHGQQWFKSIEGGRELADKVFNFGLWPQLEGQLLPFLNAIRSAIKLPEIAKLPP